MIAYKYKNITIVKQSKPMILAMCLENIFGNIINNINPIIIPIVVVGFILLYFDKKLI